MTLYFMSEIINYRMKCIKTGFVLHILSTNMITNVDLFCDEKGNAYVNDNKKYHYNSKWDSAIEGTCVEISGDENLLIDPVFTQKTIDYVKKNMIYSNYPIEFLKKYS